MTRRTYYYTLSERTNDKKKPPSRTRFVRSKIAPRVVSFIKNVSVNALNNVCQTKRNSAISPSPHPHTRTRTRRIQYGKPKRRCRFFFFFPLLLLFTGGTRNGYVQTDDVAADLMDRIRSNKPPAIIQLTLNNTYRLIIVVVVARESCRCCLRKTETRDNGKTNVRCLPHVRNTVYCLFVVFDRDFFSTAEKY